MNTASADGLAGGASPARVVETAAATFDRDVWEQSRDLPVVVDFWAAWCQPCRLLAPLLERLALEMAGRFVLVKANTDELPQQAEQFGVQAIPSVYAVVNGEILDFFQGVLPYENLRTWIDRVLIRGLLVSAERAEVERPAAAEAMYREVLRQLPNESLASIGLARVRLAQGDGAVAREILGQLERRGFLEPEAEKIKAALELEALDAGDLAARRAAVEADPDNRQRQLELAEALAGARQYEEALALCLELVRSDKRGAGQTARQVMVDIFRVLPDDSPLVRDYRRQLSLALY